MNLFLYEWTCAAGEGLGLSVALSIEGWAMLAAAAADCALVPNVHCQTLLAESCPHELGPGCRRVSASEENQAFRQLAAQADLTLVIAPECDHILWERSRAVLEVGGRLLGPLPAVVALTGDKLALAEHLQKRGVPTPLVQGAGGQGSGIKHQVFPAVCKPRFGAGSQATFLIKDRADMEETLRRARQEFPTELIVQPFVPGLAVSVAFLVGPRQQVALLPGFQHLSADGRFHYLGGEIPLPPPPAERAVRLGRQAVEAVAGLQGYVGVDLVLGEATDGSQDVVIEINPRLTTSYLGLRQLAKENLAAAMLQVVAGEEMPPLTWHEGVVRFTADGRVDARR